MKATGSTRTAMRWRLCNSVLLLCALPACVRSMDRFYVPTEGQERLSLNGLRDRADAMLRAECPRLLNVRNPATGSTDVKLDLARSGAVTRAVVTRPSGDQRIDEIFGGLAAHLTFDPPADAKGDVTAGRIRIGFSCSPTTAVTTVELR